MNKDCIYEGCGRPVKSRGFCNGHYQQNSKGQELKPIRTKKVTDRDELGRKNCAGCSDWKPVDEFFKAATKVDGLTLHCKACSRDMELRRKYGINLEQYAAMLDKQGGTCAICPKTPEENGMSLAVDHDHSCCSGNRSCGKCVRGLLCDNCNRGIGFLQDKVDVVLNAATYLMSFEDVLTRTAKEAINE